MHGPLSAQQSHFSCSALTCTPQLGEEWGALLSIYVVHKSNHHDAGFTWKAVEMVHCCQFTLYIRATTMMLALP